jgi:UPF0755 protein
MRSRRQSRKHKQRRTSLRGRRRAWGMILLVVALPAMLAGMLLVWSRLPGPGNRTLVPIEIDRDAQTTSVSRQLAHAGLINQPRLFTAYLWLSGQQHHLAAGSHLLRSASSPVELAGNLTRSARRPTAVFAIAEGFDQFRVARRLEAVGICGQSSFLGASASPALLRRLGIVGASAEGYLFPATYQLYLDSDAEGLIVRWVGETRRRLTKLDRAGSLARLREQRGWGEREVLTLASIVEKETADPSEQPIVASVFYNRLDDPDFRPLHALQSDPTAAYGCLLMPLQIPSCQQYSGHITPALLRDARNPYNTYRHPGLPPGPIANPGESAISSVLQPAHTDFLFFVAKNGKHVFTRSLGEHEAAMRAESD